MDDSNNKTNNNNIDNPNNNTTNDGQQNLNNLLINNRIQNQKNQNSMIRQPRRYNPNSMNISNNFDGEEGFYDDDTPFQNKNKKDFENKENNPINETNSIENGNNINNVPKSIDIANTPNNISNQKVGLTNDNLMPNQPIKQQKRNGEKNNLENRVKDPLQNKLNRLNQMKKLNNTDEGNQPSNIQNNSDNNQKTNNQNDNNLNPNSNNKNKKTKGSADKGETVQKTSAPKKSSMGNNLGKAAALMDVANQLQDGEQSATEVAKNIAKEKIKQKIKEKALEIFIEYIVPILPYIGIALLVILFIFIIILIILSIFSNDDIMGNEMQINYCEYVNLKWGEGEEENKTISTNEYIKYQIINSDFADIDDPETIKALTVILRTNLYASSDNLDSNVCYFEVEKEYTEESNSIISDAIEETDNKIFSRSEDRPVELEIDDNFTYIEQFDNKYKLYEDNMTYDKSWVDSHIDSSHISNNKSGVDHFAFPPFAAWALDAKYKYDYQTLLYHYLAPTSRYSYIYNAVKIGNDDDYGGYIGSVCSDISLSTTSLEKDEFISLVEKNVSSQLFRDNAEKIYDISIKNNFNPEMVIIKAYLEGNYTTQGGANNYWGLGCPNGAKTCSGYSSFDQGVLAFISNIKNHNYSSLYQMQYKYSYIGAYWFNPGSGGLGGCYYYPHLKQYLSEERSQKVAEACASGKSCKNGGVGDCLQTTDEDQAAYTKYNVEKSLKARETIFEIGVDNCVEGADIEDDGSLGAKAAKYAVETFDTWSYSQNLREKDGYVDCSSMVARAYEHVGFTSFRPNGASFTVKSEYNWCKNNGKLISESQLRPGDLVIKGNLSHVEMYIGNGKVFGAHGRGTTTNPIPQPNQVSIKNYSKGVYQYFCHIG